MIRRSEWHEHAKCLDVGPHAYDCDMAQLQRGMRGLDGRAKYAAKMCAGCPVIQDCAQEAVQLSGGGTIRGGIWLFPDREGSPRPRKAHDAGLLLVAHGYLPHQIVFDYVAGTARVKGRDRRQEVGASV